MDLNQEFERRIAKINQLKDFIALYAKKKEIIGELHHLQMLSDGCFDLLEQCVRSVVQFQKVNKDRYKQLMERTQYTQRVIMNVMDELDQRDLEIVSENSIVPQKQVFGEQKININKEQTTPLRSVNRVCYYH